MTRSYFALKVKRAFSNSENELLIGLRLFSVGFEVFA